MSKTSLPLLINTNTFQTYRQSATICMVIMGILLPIDLFRYQNYYYKRIDMSYYWERLAETEEDIQETVTTIF